MSPCYIISKERLSMYSSRHKQPHAWKKQCAHTLQLHANGFSGWEVYKVLLPSLGRRPTCEGEYPDSFFLKWSMACPYQSSATSQGGLLQNHKKGGRTDRPLPWTPLTLKIRILRHELYYRRDQQKVSCFCYLPSRLPSLSGLTLGTNWAMPATVLGRRTQGCRFCLPG